MWILILISAVARRQTSNQDILKEFLQLKPEEQDEELKNIPSDVDPELIQMLKQARGHASQAQGRRNAHSDEIFGKAPSVAPRRDYEATGMSPEMANVLKHPPSSAFPYLESPNSCAYAGQWLASSIGLPSIDVNAKCADHQFCMQIGGNGLKEFECAAYSDAYGGCECTWLPCSQPDPLPHGYSIKERNGVPYIRAAQEAQAIDAIVCSPAYNLELPSVQAHCPQSKAGMTYELIGCIKKAGHLLTYTNRKHTYVAAEEKKAKIISPEQRSFKEAGASSDAVAVSTSGTSLRRTVGAKASQDEKNRGKRLLA